ncbi:MAG TPA: hypothetical protein VHG91_02140 [Longimicrobium sp.]|nr:hypothetical protein [Longimicrobium sp.]
MQPTNVLVRVQAKGGKFLGPDIGYSRVTIRDVASGAVLAQGVAAGGSGALATKFAAGASREVIVTPQTSGAATVQWLSAPAGTAGLTAALQLDAPTLVEISATGLAGGLPSGPSVSQRMWITPGADLTEEPGVVLVIPGLAVQILSPSVSKPAAAPLQVTAWVTMMCGCKIDPSLPWHPAQFAVTARVRQLDGDFVIEVPLDYVKTSTFVTPAPLTLAGAGNYELIVGAVQAAEGNVGSASVFFSVAS